MPTLVLREFQCKSTNFDERERREKESSSSTRYNTQQQLQQLVSEIEVRLPIAHVPTTAKILHKKAATF